jgi:putative phage-type endonuclease
MGVSPYKTLTGVWLDKKGITDESEIKNNEAIYWGNALESVIADRYARDAKTALQKGEFKQSGIVGGTIDFFDPNSDKIIEIKTAGMRQLSFWGESTLEQVPTQYLCQVMWYLGLHEKEKADIAVLIAGNDYRVYPITFNPELFGIMKDMAEDFWSQYIIGNKEPTPDGSDDYNRYLNAVAPQNNGKIAIPTEEVREVVTQVVTLKSELKKIEKNLDIEEQKLKAMIGELDGFKDNTLTATWKKSKDSEKTDWRSVAMDLALELNNEALWESSRKQHTTISEGSRRLYIK